jgi:hypothetical protein
MEADVEKRIKEREGRKVGERYDRWANAVSGSSNSDFYFIYLENNSRIQFRPGLDSSGCKQQGFDLRVLFAEHLQVQGLK